MTTLFALVIAVFLPFTSPQAARPSADPDLRELSTYTLTLETLNKVDRVNRAMTETMKQDPKYAEQIKLQAELDALKKKDDTTAAEDKRREQIEARLETLDEQNTNPLNMNDAKNLTEMAARIQAFPPLVAALRTEGMTPRDYARFMLASLQAGLAAGLQKAGMLKETPAGVNPANIKFILEHEAEFKKLQGGGGMP